MDDSSLEGLFDIDEIDNIVVQEGLSTVTDLFEYFVEALEVAVQWLHDLLEDDEEYSHDKIRGIISANVEKHDLDDIMGKLEAIYEFSGLEDEE